MGYCNRELVREFFKQEKETAKSNNGTLFFENETLYSYGRHYPLCRLRDNLVFVNCDHYSTTTGKHQAIVRRSIPTNRLVFQVPTDAFIVSSDTTESIDVRAVIDHYFKRIKEEHKTAMRSRKYKDYHKKRTENIHQVYTEFCSIFDIPVKSLENIL